MRFLERIGFDLLLLAKVVLIVVATFVVERLVRKLLKRMYLRSEKGQEDRTRYRFMRNATRFIVGTVAAGCIIYSIPSFKQFAVTLFAGAGIFVAILGLATQRAFSNIISGVFIVSFKPFRVGDSLRVGERYSGVVEDITLRHTVLVTSENRRVIIPNALISDETLVNSSIGEEATCEFVEVAVAYDSDLDRAMAALRDEAERHPMCMDRRTPEQVEQGDPKVAVLAVQLGEYAVLLRAYAWAKDPVVSKLMHYELNRMIKLRFDQEGISIPHPQRDIKINGPITVRTVSDEKGQ